MELCGTPFLKCFVVEDLPLRSVYACVPDRKLACHFLESGCLSNLRIFFRMGRLLRTVSKALLMSIASLIVLCAFFC